MSFTRFIKALVKYFLQGLLFLAPVGITVYVIYKVLEVVDSWFRFKIPGLGFLLLIAIITVMGLIGSTILARPLVSLFDDVIGRIPGIKILYSSVKEFMEAFMGHKKRFTEPVLVKIYEGTGLMKMGFVTDRNLSQIGLGEEYIAVYFPHSYNFSGNLFFVPAKNIIPLEGSSSELMKYIVTAGVTTLGEKEEEP